MPTLYDLTAELNALLEDMEMWAEDHGGDITDYPLERIEKLEGDVKTKVLNIAVLIKDLRAEEKALKEEKLAVAKRQAAKGNKEERLLKYLESALPKNAKFESARAVVSWANNPPAVVVLAKVEHMPEKYLVRPEPQVAKEKLKADMLPYQVPELDDQGAPIPGPDGQPLMRTEVQVRWPREGGGEYTLAKMVQGKRISIK